MSDQTPPVSDTEEVKSDAPGVVHIERGPWDIDPALVTEVQELAPNEVLVLTPQASYRLTREEAKPFLE